MAPNRLKKSSRAEWNGATLAQSVGTVIVEGNHYFPANSVDKSRLKPSATTTKCSWKAMAHYYTVSADGKDNADAAWCYSDPKPAAVEIKNRIAFWKGVQVSQAIATLTRSSGENGYLQPPRQNEASR